MTEECLSHGYLTGEQKRNKKCTVLSSIPYSTCYLFWKCYAHTLFYALCSLLSFLPTSWLSLLTLLTKPGSFTSAQPSVFKFWVTFTYKAEYLRYLCWNINIKLKKVIFLSKSDCHLINIDFFFFSVSGDFTTSWIPEEINIQYSSMSHLYTKSQGPSRSHFKSISSLVWSASVPFHSRKMGVSCFSKKKQVPASPGYHFLSFFPYYYMCKLAVLIFACCQQCFALLMEAIYPKRKFDAKNWKGAKW